MDGVLQPLHTVEPQARSCGIQVAEGRDTLPNAVREMLSPDKVGADDELTECLRTIVLLQRQHSPPQRRQYQLSAITHQREVRSHDGRFQKERIEANVNYAIEPETALSKQSPEFSLSAFLTGKLPEHDEVDK